MMHFRKYRLRSKIDFQSTDAYRIWSIWGPGTAQLNWKYRANTQTETNTSSDKQLDSIADIGLEDRRAGGHAFRVVLPVDQQRK
jgi:folate-binding Fe-S cluster repair protein YgfZ